EILKASGVTSIHRHIRITGCTVAGLFADQCQVTRYEQIECYYNSGVGFSMEGMNSSLFVSCSALYNTSHGFHIRKGSVGGTVTLLVCQAEQNLAAGVLAEGVGFGAGQKLQQLRVVDCIFEANGTF